MKDLDRKFDAIWEYLKNYAIKMNAVCFGITLLGEGKIMYGYKLPTKILNRNQAIQQRIRK